MNEEKWLECADYEEMLIHLGPAISHRKSCLFGCACCRVVWDHLGDARSRLAVEVAERWADRDATDEDLEAAHAGAEAAYRAVEGPGRAKDASFAAMKATSLVPAWDAPASVTWVFAWDGEVARGIAEWRVASLLREIAGNPFKPVSFDPTWKTPTVTGLAEAIYQERSFELMPVLADALEEAGCDADAVRHCREQGPHVRGCWVIDLLLNKE